MSFVFIHLDISQNAILSLQQAAYILTYTSIPEKIITSAVFMCFSKIAKNDC